MILDVLQGDCISEMQKMQADSIDLIITSPPYAKQRRNTYGGLSEKDYVEWFCEVADEIKRIMRPTGSFVLNIKEHVSAGVRSDYVLRLVQELSQKLRLTDVYIWVKTNPFPTGSKRRLKDGFEYCYWFTKTKDYNFYPENVLVRTTSKWVEHEKKRKNKGEHPVTNGSGLNMSRRYVSDMVRPSNVITIPVDSTNHKHPATFPVGLPAFFIKAMTDENATVLDPFAGSGTTGVACARLGRQFIGIEINEEYCEMARARIRNEEMRGRSE